MTLFAVHISDGILDWPWLVGGFALAAILALVGGWRIRDEEIPRTALLSAAFFAASAVPVPLGVTSVHLLFNGLLGVVLGRRACLAIPVGLFLQAALFGHGGFTTLGVNSCILAFPALLSSAMFVFLQRIPWVRHPGFRSGFVAVSTMLWTLSLVYGLALLLSNRLAQPTALDTSWADSLTFHPLTLLAVLSLTCLAVWTEQRLENAPEFPLGLWIGAAAVLVTMLLNCLVLFWGGQEDWRTLALLTFVAHMPVVVVEGVVVGFAVGFLTRVKPEILGWATEGGRRMS